MAASPESRFKPITDVVRQVKENPVAVVAPVGAFLSIVTMPIWMPSLNGGIDSLQRVVADTQFVRDWNERAERQRQSIEAVAKARQDVLEADFEQTDGVDKTKVAGNSWLITITRPSSTLGGSPQEILSRVATRVGNETGCKALVISEAYVDRTPRWFSMPNPTVYSVSATDCPK